MLKIEAELENIIVKDQTFAEEACIKCMASIKELTPGEIRAFKRGQQIVSDEQMAVNFLVAKYELLGLYPKFSRKFQNSLGIECGMSQETFRRNVEKFKLIISGKHEDPEETAKEVIFPKLIDAHAEFAEMSEDDVYAMAELAFNEDNLKMGLAMALEKAENQKQSSDEYKKLDAKIKTNLISLYNSLYKVFRDVNKSKRQAISKIVKELEVSEDRVTRVWNTIEILKGIK